MIQAILEILVLLTISCLIGIFFTYRFWRVKYHELQTQNTALETEVNRLKDEISALQSQASSREKDLIITNGRLTNAQNQLKKPEFLKPESSKAHTAELKKLKEEISTLRQEIDATERELEAVSHELEQSKISYYKYIDGKRLKSSLIKLADEAVAGRGDGRISILDAENIFDNISNGIGYTQVEKHTIKYLRENYNWTDEADALFRTKIRSWAALDHELVESTQSFIKNK